MPSKRWWVAAESHQVQPPDPPPIPPLPFGRQRSPLLLRACGTCRKALAWLAEQGISADVLDITRTPPSRHELEEALKQLGSRARLFNTSGQRYRALGATRVAAMDDGAALDALAADGMLIKRPFLITAQGGIVTGFRPLEWQSLLRPPEV